jgi:hypothetical protein
MRAAMAVAAARFVTPQLWHKATRIRLGHLARLSPVPVADANGRAQRAEQWLVRIITSPR